MYTVDTCPHYGCGDCKYFRVDADRNESLCKRIDHKKVKFAIPWFKSYDCGQHFHLPCNDFEPKHMEYADAKEWSGFDNFWNAYKEAWLPYKNEHKLTWFCLNDNKNVRYGVPIKSFVEGTMIQNNKLMAVKKAYYKRVKDFIGYELLYEDIKDGVDLNGC